MVMPGCYKTLRKGLTQRFEPDACLLYPFAKGTSGQHPVLLLARGIERILRLGAQTGVAHQQVAAAAGPKPPACPLQVAVFVAPEIVHPQQVRVLAKTSPLRLPRQCGRAQGFNGPGLDCLPPGHWRVRVRFGVPRRVSQPGQVTRIPPLQLGQQFASHDRELVNMLVPIDVRGCAAGLLFKRV